MAKILVIHGPNLNLLGTREPEHYGSKTLVQIDDQLAEQASQAGHSLSSVQSNAEHDLVDAVQQNGSDGLILAGFGGGTFPPAVIQAAVRAVAAGTPVVLASRSTAGRGHPRVGRRSRWGGVHRNRDRPAQTGCQEPGDVPTSACFGHRHPQCRIWNYESGTFILPEICQGHQVHQIRDQPL